MASSSLIEATVSAAIDRLAASPRRQMSNTKGQVIEIDLAVLAPFAIR
jgi:hypothetical protein